ncbi:MAG TPA: hypothetical protein DD636_05160 [Anaerolineaceae bacterium]|nr:hypothetical protein [Anaerolineaceae bacterium]
MIFIFALLSIAMTITQTIVVVSLFFLFARILLYIPIVLNTDSGVFRTITRAKSLNLNIINQGCCIRRIFQNLDFIFQKIHLH